MLALMVASLCVGGYACDQATSAYYKSRPELRHFVRASRRRAEAAVGKEILIAGAIAYAVATDKSYAVRMGKHFSVQMSTERNLILFRKEF